MKIAEIIAQNSWAWLLVALPIGAGYAVLLYQKKAPWSRAFNYGLAAARFIVVSLLAILLLINPLVRQVINTLEKPIVVFALDNSESVAKNTAALDALLKQIDALTAQLAKEDVKVVLTTFNQEDQLKNFAQVKFDAQATPLSAMLGNIQNLYENQNLDKIILLTDGIFNQGASPLYNTYKASIFTVGLGDPVPKKDLRVQAVIANKIAYLNNQFPIVADIAQTGFPNQAAMVYLSQQGVVIDKKSIQLKGDNDVVQVSFLANAKTIGNQHFVVSVDALPDEFSQQNNSRDVYVEVIDGKQKILIVSASPHPDVKALRLALAKNENFTIDIHLPGVNTLKNEKYDVVILHQIPNTQRIGDELWEKFRKEQTPILYIVGSQSNFNSLNNTLKSLKIVPRGSQMDKVTPIWNDKFSKFTFDAKKTEIFKKFPPLSVPFGEVSAGANWEVLMRQRVGTVETQKPLLLLSPAPDEKVAVLLGEGLWQWRMEEFDITQKTELVDELLNKLLQFLNLKEDRRRLKVYPINNEFYDFEKVVFEAEIYNENFERVYGDVINLQLTDGNGKASSYTFTPTAENSRFEIGGLPKGVYAYTASATLKGKVETVKGNFMVKSMQLEDLTYTADHNMLQQLAEKNKGKFFLANQVEPLAKALLENRKPNLIHSREEVQELIHWWWLFFVVLVLASAEWVVRKYMGSY